MTEREINILAFQSKEKKIIYSYTWVTAIIIGIMICLIILQDTSLLSSGTIAIIIMAVYIVISINILSYFEKTARDLHLLFLEDINQFLRISKISFVSLIPIVLLFLIFICGFFSNYTRSNWLFLFSPLILITYCLNVFLTRRVYKIAMNII